MTRQDYHLTQPCPSEEKQQQQQQQQQQQKTPAQISPSMMLTQTTEPTLRRQKPKGRKDSVSRLKSGKRKPQTQ